MRRKYKKGDGAFIPVHVVRVNDSQNYPEYWVESERGRGFSVYEDELVPRGGELVRTTGIRDLSGKKIQCRGRLSADGFTVFSEKLPDGMDEGTKRIIANYSVIFGAGLADGRLMASCSREGFEDCCERLAQAYFTALVLLSKGG